MIFHVKMVQMDGPKQHQRSIGGSENQQESEEQTNNK